MDFKMVVAVLHARGGSKRIPQKNIKLFFGKPLIYYPLQAAFNCKIFDRVVISTDSEEIAEISKAHGAEVPYLRPAALADDFTPTEDVLKFDIQQLLKQGDVNYVCCIYATAVFLTSHYLKKGYETIFDNNIVTAFSVTTFPFPIFRALKVNAKNQLEMLWPEHRLTRSQDLPEAYHDAGQFYWVNAKRFLEKPILYSDDAMPVILPRYLVQDIDTIEDWKRAEFMYAALKKEKIL
jgi:pseudaminic acid cytidylyltransferase